MSTRLSRYLISLSTDFDLEVEQDSDLTVAHWQIISLLWGWKQKNIGQVQDQIF